MALAAAVLLGGCARGSGSFLDPEPEQRRSREPAPAAIRVPPLRDRVIGVEHLRRAVLRGIGRDYLGGTQVGPPSFGLCLQRGMRTLLDERRLRSLAATYRRHSGQQLTAQALSEMAVPIGSRCGGRRFVPMLIEASMAFRAGRLPRRSASLPPDWRRSEARLVPLLSPREVLSVGTFPMPPGGGGNCGREPVAAIRRMRPGDALITVQEYEVTPRMRRRPHFSDAFPPRASQLDLEGLRFGRVARVGKDPGDRGVAATWGTIPFGESGRAFDALVYFRGRPGPELRRQVSRVLGGLDLGSRRGD
jgi:hypothetical protein